MKLYKQKKQILMKKTQNVNHKTSVFLAYLLITVTLLIVVSIYYYAKKRREKQNISYHFPTQN